VSDFIELLGWERERLHAQLAEKHGPDWEDLPHDVVMASVTRIFRAEARAANETCRVSGFWREDPWSGVRARLADRN
jgi:isocitrate lyase